MSNAATTLSPRAPSTPSMHDGDETQALYVQGLQCLQAGDVQAALPLLERAVAGHPAHPGRRRNLVRALLAAQRYDAVLHHVQAGFAHDPDDAELHVAMGCALSRSSRPVAARAAFSQAVALQPDHAAAWLNLGNTCFDLDDVAAAEAHYRKALALDAVLPEALVSLGYLLTRQGKLPEALDCFDAAIQARPDLVQAHWNRAIALLLSGNLREGFAAYECRKAHPRFQQDFPTLPWPRWDGSAPAGRTILVRGEQGDGDAIQFVRFLSPLRDAGARPVLHCSAALAPLFRANGIAVAANPKPSDAYDGCVDLCSLPYRLGTSLDTIPAAPAYLSAAPARIEHWRQRLPAGRKIGMAFAGNPGHSGDRWRSVPPALLAPLLETPGMTFVNLQHGAAASSLPLPDLTPDLPDYAETAALVANLDLVISADTAVAHLAAALGKPTWIMLPFAPDWRWMLQRTDSPWYPSVRLYRQPEPGDWRAVLTRVGEDLKG